MIMKEKNVRISYIRLYIDTNNNNHAKIAPFYVCPDNVTGIIINSNLIVTVHAKRINLFRSIYNAILTKMEKQIETFNSKELQKPSY